MAMWMDRNITMGTHMGAEGAQWIGLAPFTEVPHIIQNMGDGTFFHSGLLALNYAVASGVNITYKLLYNAAVAMTGGQDAMGTLPVPALARELDAVGVRRTIITTDEPERYAQTSLPASCEVWHRDRLVDAQRLLAATPGVTVMIHDQQCAAEKRRLRGRGLLEDPPTRIFIDEGVCEGCGDCGRKSNCLSVEPLDTEFGRKTRIHQPSCNKDYSCLLGDCPSFVSVTLPNGAGKAPGKRRPAMTRPLPDPVPRVPDHDFAVHVMGIGGTGVVTVAQIMGTAAMLDGRFVVGLDQTGLAQKGGPVVSDVKFSSQPIDGANRISNGGADLYLAFDIITAAQRKNLDTCDPARTVAVVATGKVPTGKMVVDSHLSFPERKELVGTIDGVTRAGENFYADGQGIAEALFNDSLAANMLMVGIAHQIGALPISAQSIEEAIRRNGVAVEMNHLAFRWGRALVVDPAYVMNAMAGENPPMTGEPVLDDVARNLVELVDPGDELRRLLEIRVPELVAYQDARYAREYVEFVKRVVDAERRACPGRSELGETVARNLFKLMAYKDEYEVARLHLKTFESGALLERFGRGIRFAWHLHPPMLRALGLKKKLRFGAWFAPVLRLLRASKKVRGTWLDPFGYAKLRRIERELIAEYRSLIEDVLRVLDGARYPEALALAGLADEIRGYEEVKLTRIEQYRHQAREMIARLSRAAAA